MDLRSHSSAGLNENQRKRQTGFARRVRKGVPDRVVGDCLGQETNVGGVGRTSWCRRQTRQKATPPSELLHRELVLRWHITLFYPKLPCQKGLS